jgi:3-oxoacyl-(acyl-carrier-protein) synthase
LKRETVVQVVDACLKKAKLKFNDLDLVVFDNVDKDKSQIGALVTLREGGKTKLLTPSLFLGHPICANGGAMITTALMCLKHQKIFSSYLDSVPDEPELTAEEEEMNLNRILVLSQGLNNSLHGLILEKA